MNFATSPAVDVPRRDPISQAYLEQLRRTLEKSRVEPHEVDAIVIEMHNHLAEAARAGRPLADVIKGLGPPLELAEAYCVALTFDCGPSVSGWRRAVRFVERVARRLASGLWVGSGVLLAVLLTAVGSASVAAAAILPFVPARLLDPTLRMGMPQIVVMLIGLAALGLGWQLFRRLRLHSLMRRNRPALRNLPSSPDSGVESEQRPVAPLAYFPSTNEKTAEETEA